MSSINIIAYTTVLIQLVGVSFYIRDMFRGTTKPNRVSWIIWALGPIIGAWLQWQVGAGLSVLPVFMAGFNPILVVIASFIIKEGYWKITKLDVVCGIIAFLSLVLWVVTRSFSISILFAIVSDLLAGIPTIIKSWKFPETETSSAYIGGLTANILGLFIIKEWIFPIYSFGAYLILLNVVLIFCIYRKKIFRIKVIA